MYIKQFCGFALTSPYCWLCKLINGDSGIKREAGKILQTDKQGVLNKVGEGGKKQNN